MARNENIPWDGTTYQLTAYKGPWDSIAKVIIKYPIGESGWFAYTKDTEAFVYWNADLKTWKKLGINKTDLVNNLTSDDVTKFLAAPQGKVLKEMIDTLNGLFELEVDNRNDADFVLQTNIEVEATSRTNADNALQDQIDGLQGGLVDGIAFDAAAPTPGKTCEVEFITAGAYPSWLTPTSPVTANVQVGDRAIVKFTAPSTYEYKYVPTAINIVQTLAGNESGKSASVVATNEGLGNNLKLSKNNTGEISLIGTGTDWTNVGYIRNDTGAIEANTDYAYSGKYLAIPGAILNLLNFGGTTSIRKVEFYDNLGVLITASNVVTASTDIRVVTPLTAMYQRFCYKKYTSGVLNTNATVNCVETVSERISEHEIFSLLTVGALKSSIIAVKNAVRSVNILGATFSNGETYSLTVCTNTPTLAQLRIFKRVATTNTEVCQYSLVQTSAKTGIEKVLVPAFNSSGITAVIVVDWDLVTTTYSSLYPDVWKFTDAVYLKKNSDYGYLAFERTGIIFDSVDDLIHGKVIHGSDWLNSGYISEATGLPTENSVYCYSDMYNCYPNLRITMQNFGGSASIRKCEFFDKNGISITTGKVVTIYSNATTISPSNARYVRFCYLKSVSVGVDYAEPARVIFEPYVWTRRQSNLIVTLPNFSKQANSTVSNQGVNAIGDQTWKRHLQYEIDTYLEHLKLVAAIHINSLPNSALSVGIGRYSDGITSDTELRITTTNFELWIVNPTGTSTLEYQTPLTGMTVASGSDFILTLEKTTDGCICTISDGFTTISKTISKTVDSGIADEASFAKCWGNPYLAVVDGDILIKSISVSSDYDPKSSSVGIWGDSFVEGSTLIGSGLENRYSAKIATALGAIKCPLFGHGGQDINDTWFYNFTVENDWFRPKYVLIALGTNNTVFSAYQATMLKVIAHIKKCGQIPVLVTVTPRPDVTGTAFRDFRIAANAWIRETAGERYIDMAKAVTVPGDESTWKTGYVLDDLTHPSVTGHNAMFIQAQIDVPEIFNF